MDTYRALKDVHQRHKEARADVENPPPVYTIQFHDEPEVLHRQLYYPGARAKATLTISNPRSTSLRIMEPQVSLIGQVETRNTKHVTSPIPGGNMRFFYHSSAIVLCLTKKLGNDFTLEASEERSFDVGFAFPLHGADANAQPLPPSCRDYHTFMHFATTSYFLQPQVTLPLRQKPFAKKSRRLDYKDFATQPLPSDKTGDFGHKHSFASSRLIGEEKSLSHSFRDVFSRQTPSVEVAIRTSMGSKHTIGSSFSIAVIVEISKISLPSIRIPSVDIKITSLKLKSVTECTAKRVNHLHIKPLDDHTIYDEGDVPLNVLSESTPGSMADPYVEHAYRAEFESRIPGDQAPSFQTTNMSRAYVLEARIEAEFCGKVFKHHAKVDITLLSDLDQSKVVVNEQKLPDGWTIQRDPPPAYDSDEEEQHPGDMKEEKLQ